MNRQNLGDGSGKKSLLNQEALTRDFYAWEERGRGWQLWDYPVELEPAFTPFIGHFLQPGTHVDDGRIETVGSFIASLFKGRQTPPKLPEIELEEYEPHLFYPDVLPTEYSLSIPPNLTSSLERAKALIQGFPSFPGCFEIIGDGRSTRVQFAGFGAPALIKSHIRSYYPGVGITEPENSLVDLWERAGDHSLIIDLGLSEEFMLTLPLQRRFEIDPFIPLFNYLDTLEEGEISVLQVCFAPTRYPWAESVIRAVSDHRGGAFFRDSPGLQRAAEEKLQSPLLAVQIRLGVKAHTSERVWECARQLGFSLSPLTADGANALIPLSNDEYPDIGHELDFLTRTTLRSGMLLSLDELVGFVHLPGSSVHSKKLVRETRKTKRAPRIAKGNDLILGDNYHEGGIEEVTLSTDQRTRHIHIIGASGTGKSHLLVSMIRDDILAGSGVAVLDPHGDLIDRIIGYIPEERVKDVVLFDPADEEYPLGFNILSAEGTLEQELLAADMVAIFKRLATSWGDQMTSVLGNALLAILTSSEGGTLRDLRRFLVEKPFRMSLLPTIEDEEIRYYWEHEYPLLSGRPQAPILTRLDSFLRPRLIRRMVSQKDKTLDIASIMDEGKIVLAKLSHGLLGEENSYLLGALLVSRFYQSALGRQAIKEEERNPFFLYLDEFHHFITPSLKTLLSGARKYRLGLTLAHQDLEQINQRDKGLLGSLLTNPYTRIAFRVGERDSKTLSQGFSFFEAEDLQNLGRGEAIVRLERSDFDFNLETRGLPQTESNEVEALKQQLVSYTREHYATPREEVDAFLKGSLRSTPTKKPDPPPKKEKLDKKEEEIPDSPSPPPAPVENPQSEVKTQEPKPLGRGGKQHIYLQSLLQRYAEGVGLRASIEESLPSGGSVDIVVHTEETKIAIEISITTSPEHELGNIRKCLNGGFDTVVLVSPHEKRLTQIEKYVSKKLSKEERERVLFLSPEGFFEFVDRLPNSRSEKVVGGYKVKVQFDTPEEEEIEARRQALSRIVAEAMKKMKDK